MGYKLSTKAHPYCNLCKANNRLLFAHRISALFLALCISLSAAVVIVAADTVQLVSASEVTVTAGNTAYVTLRGENFKNIAALDVYVYYDPSVMTLSSTSNGSLLSGAACL